ncbi:hypothetical protein AV656_03920 [Bhargavaea cecembensis]|uniref:GerMN domain-containing protein n=1 Tax=Bhargavaea cecembensis TaxID=394098 RepID=A0A165GXP3_9BACL|nr:Ish1 domain-containing protein [Bhargavaea cecembensis]KZE38084.1 hypothetical protein AV656_03920 [Bhargavaea cecembensis]
MSRDKWNDEEIGRWLKSVPKPEDRRSRDEILSRLKDDPRLRDKRPSRIRKWIPAGVAAAALLAAGILIPSMMDGGSEMSGANDTASEHADDAVQKATEADRQAETGSVEESSALSDKGSTSEGADLHSMEVSMSGPAIGAVYPGKLEGLVPFRIGLVEAANVIPVTFLIPGDRIEADFAGETPGQVDLYNRYAPQIDEEALGFDDYHPYDGTVGEEEGEVILILNGNHSYDIASAAIGAFTDSLQETFRDSPSLQVLDESGAPAEFDQVGPLQEMPLEREGAVYFSYEKSDGSTILAPDRHLEPADAAEAIRLMKDRTNDLYEPVVPEDADFTVELPGDGDVLTVRFGETFDFGEMEQQDAARMIDGMALTAAEYNLRVRFENADNPPGGYDLDEAIPLPAGPNGMSLDTGS